MSALAVPVMDRDHALGSPDAAVTLVEYGDFQCGFCGMAHPIVQSLLARFAADLCFVFRHFPLSQVHPLAAPAAEAAEFAGEQDQFWPMHDAIYDQREELGLPLLCSLAEELDLSSGELAEALDQHIYAARVRADFQSGVRSGVNGTPTFFINGVRHDAGYDLPTLEAAIMAALRKGPRAGVPA